MRMDKKSILREITCGRNATRVTAGTFSVRYPDAYAELIKWEFPDGFSFGQKVYHYLYDDNELLLGLCPICGKRCRFNGLSRGYGKYCSNSCRGLSDDTRELRAMTCVERYGVENPMGNETVKNKRKATCFKRYDGIGYASPEISEKIRQTSLERYGNEIASMTESVEAKRKATCIERYGAEYAMSNESVNGRRMKTCENKYGGVGYASDVQSKKARQTSLERYGNEIPSCSDAVRERIRAKWSAKRLDEMNEIAEKRALTNLERYGDEYAVRSTDAKNRKRDTCVKRYGVENPAQCDDVKCKIRKSVLERYGVVNPSQSEFVKSKVRDAWDRKTKEEIDDIVSRRYRTLIDRYGCAYPSEFNQLTHFKISKINLAFASVLDTNGITYDMEFGLDRYSYDFKVGDTLVEINPTITHNSSLNVFGGEPKQPDYHLLKSKTATENGYRCIHIWDWDDTGKIISMLKPKQTLYARKLELREVGDKECNEFLNKYHLQNTCRGQAVRLGLYMNGILVELMTFGKPRYNRNYEYELLRLCSHSDYMVVGGAERLFKYFAEHYSPQSIISYCDASKFDGEVYERLGFELLRMSKPTKHWWDGRTHITDNLLRQRGFDQLFNADYGKGTNNDELMFEHGFLPVYDCGQVSYKYYVLTSKTNRDDGSKVQGRGQGSVPS